MLRFFDFQVNLSTDQGRIKEIEVTARMTGNQEVIVETRYAQNALHTMRELPQPHSHLGVAARLGRGEFAYAPVHPPVFAGTRCGVH
jgi:hypothetical protein